MTILVAFDMLDTFRTDTEQLDTDFTLCDFMILVLTKKNYTFFDAIRL